MLSLMAIKLCDVQGRLFEMATKNEFDSAMFINTFMGSDIAKALDEKHNHMQWAGEEYLFEEVKALIGEENKAGKANIVFTEDVMYWIGYVYRYWHYYTGETSARILKQAPVKTMKRSYLMFHTLSPEMAIDNLREIFMEKKGSKWG